MFRGPWPLVCLGLPARFRSRPGHPDRSGSVPDKGPGHTPAPRMRDTELNSPQTCFRHPHRLVALAAIQGSSGCFGTCGFLDVSFLIMDDKKKASALSRAWTLAYAQPADKSLARTEPQPGLCTISLSWDYFSCWGSRTSCDPAFYFISLLTVWIRKEGQGLERGEGRTGGQWPDQGFSGRCGFRQHLAREVTVRGNSERFTA